MSEEEIKAYYERIEKLLNGANKETYGFAPQEIKNILRSHEILGQENQELKKQLEECQLQNFNLREDIILKKMSFPNKEIKDKSFLELYDMPSYEDLKKENQRLKETIIKAIELIKKCVELQLKEDYLMNRANLMNYSCNLLNILESSDNK